MKERVLINQWLTPKEITKLEGMPGSVAGVHKKAKREDWDKRPLAGKQGAGVEYLVPYKESEEIDREKLKLLMKDEWLTADQLIDVPGLPTTVAGVHYRARQQSWVSRPKDGIKGGKAIEYSLISMPYDSLKSIFECKYIKNQLRKGGSVNEQINSSLQYVNEAKKLVMANLSTGGLTSNEELILSIFRSLSGEDNQRLFISKVMNLAAEFFSATSVPTDSREILREDNSTENTRPAPQVSTHDKKAG